jgi:hypothetical protein
MTTGRTIQYLAPTTRGSGLNCARFIFPRTFRFEIATHTSFSWDSNRPTAMIRTGPVALSCRHVPLVPDRLRLSLD